MFTILYILAYTTLTSILFISLYNRHSSLVIVAALNAMVLLISWKLWAVSIPLSILFFIPFVRRNLITRFVLIFIKKKNVLPQISETEEVALNAGTIWVESEFFTGKPDFMRIAKEPYNDISAAEHAFLNNEVEELCKLVTEQQIQDLQDLPREAWKYMCEKGFLE